MLFQNIFYDICNRYSLTCIDHCVCITMHFFMLHNWKNIWWKDLSFVVSALSENAPETSKKQPWKIASVDFCLFARIHKIVSFVLNYKQRFNSSHILDKNQNSWKMWSESWSCHAKNTDQKSSRLFSLEFVMDTSKEFYSHE